MSAGASTQMERRRSGMPPVRYKPAGWDSTLGPPTHKHTSSAGGAGLQRTGAG